MPELHVVDHPLVQHKISHIRDVRTGVKEFRELTEEVAMLVAYEATRSLATKEIEVRTPMAACTGRVVATEQVAVIAILRAGLGMVGGILRLLPMARVGHLGMYRDEQTLRPVEYYAKLPPDLGARTVIVTDPMLATGGSACAALHYLKEKGARDLRFMSLLAAPEGVARVHEAHPDVPIFTGALDSHLNANGFIVPGLGDAGDRLFGTPV